MEVCPVRETEIDEAVAIERALFEPASYGEHGPPWETWKNLRSHDSLFRTPGAFCEPVWVATRYADVSAISRRTEHFSNSPNPMIRTREHERARFQIRSAIPLPPDLLELDGEGHRQKRLAVLRWVSERFSQEVTPMLPGIVAASMDRAQGDTKGGEFDVVASVASEVPLAVMCAILGVSFADARQLAPLAHKWVAPTDAGDDIATGNALHNSTTGLAQYFDEFLQNRSADGQSPLAQLEQRLGHPSRQEMVGHLILLLVSGFETTSNAIAGAFEALANAPMQFRQLKSSRAIPTAVEEILRWSSPLVHFARTLRVDVDFGRTCMHAGDKVVLFYPSANRDETVFESPERFDATRAVNPHLTFGGGGVHHCLGASIARAELATVLDEVLRRFDTLQLVSARGWTASNFVAGRKLVVVKPTFSRSTAHA